MDNKLPSPDKIKLIATDLDGTLLNPKGEISERTSTVIQKVLNKYPDLHFVLATSREKSATKHIREILGILNRPNTESVLLNGCAIYDSDGKIIRKKLLPNEFVFKFHKILKTYSDNNYICSCEDDAILFNDFLEKHARTQFQKQTVLTDEEEYMKKVAANEVQINKICYLGYLANSKSRALEIKDKVDELVKEYNLEAAYSLDELFFEYMPHQTNKGSGLGQLLESLNIPKEEAMAFGDGGNDIEFFENAGWPVAMGNACDELRPLAKLITKSNAEDGVAYMLEKIFLQEEQMN